MTSITCKTSSEFLFRTSWWKIDQDVAFLCCRELEVILWVLSSSAGLSDAHWVATVKYIHEYIIKLSRDKKKFFFNGERKLNERGKNKKDPHKTCCWSVIFLCYVPWFCVLEHEKLEIVLSVPARCCGKCQQPTTTGQDCHESKGLGSVCGVSSKSAFLLWRAKKAIRDLKNVLSEIFTMAWWLSLYEYVRLAAWRCAEQQPHYPGTVDAGWPKVYPVRFVWVHVKELEHFCTTWTVLVRKLVVIQWLESWL